MTPETLKAAEMLAGLEHGDNMAAAGDFAVRMWTGQWPGQHRNVHMHTNDPNSTQRVGSPAQGWTLCTSSPHRTYSEFRHADCPDTVVIESRRNPIPAGEATLGTTTIRAVLPTALLRQYQIEADEGSPLFESRIAAIGLLQQYLRDHPPSCPARGVQRRRSAPAAQALAF